MPQRVHAHVTLYAHANKSRLAYAVRIKRSRPACGRSSPAGPKGLCLGSPDGNCCRHPTPSWCPRTHRGKSRGRTQLETHIRYATIESKYITLVYTRYSIYRYIPVYTNPPKSRLWYIPPLLVIIRYAGQDDSRPIDT